MGIFFQDPKEVNLIPLLISSKEDPLMLKLRWQFYRRIMRIS